MTDPVNEPSKVTIYDWARWIAGSLIFCGMLYLHIFHKEIPLLLFGFPAFLIGVKPESIIDRIGGKK